MKRLLLPLFFLLLSLLGFSQEEYFYISGNVSDCKENKSLIYTNIVNETSGYAVASNSLGNFQIKVKAEDILRFTSVGYKPRFMVVSINNIDEKQMVCLNVDTVRLQEVTVLPFSNYTQFKTQFLALKIKDNNYVIPGITLKKKTLIHNFENEKYINSLAFAVASPISYLYYNFSKREQNIRRYYELENDKWNVYSIDQKYNKQIVERITGLKNDATIKFMTWCNFGRDYLLSATDYEIVLKITEKFKLYCEIFEHK